VPWPILSQGLLKAGNIRLESHFTSIEPGSEHEAVGTHLHSEIWLITEGTLELNINGTPHLLNAGDVGLEHFSCCWVFRKGVQRRFHCGKRP